MKSVTPFILKHRDQVEPKVRDIRDSELSSISGGGIRQPDNPCGCDTMTSTPDSDGGDDGQD
ncbi:hypothetical protein [Pseudoalteromonas sp. S2755]|uniref:hypothetical protein n=1 Tax=Pseudoalteromonas sp. S2755 TaxID=2066523 RepID=UPI00110B5333|nr:hypothetical protein [Pseudoalteromonas sp. S2755]TMN39345.1 hypothetical protein CWC03_10085 [Pseudoalteromonas sp. S2755]